MSDSHVRRQINGLALLAHHFKSTFAFRMNCVSVTRTKLSGNKTKTPKK